MRYPLSTGQAAQFIRTTEPRLAETVRRGKVRPAPAVVAGRRLWEREHLVQAATYLDLLTEDLRRDLGVDTDPVQLRSGEASGGVA